MFTLRYIGAELRRRKGRTILTALGLGVGVATVVAVAALSAGLDEAQSEVLEPLTGVGTDMSVTRPIVITQEEGEGFAVGPGAELSAKEQKQLQRENGGGERIGLTDRGEPGERFTDQNFMSPNLSFPEREASRIAQTNGVEDVAPALTLDSVTISGKVPEEDPAAGAGPQIQVGPPPESVDFQQSTVSGVDVRSPDLALVTPDQITDGRYLRTGEKDEAVVTTTYAEQNGIGLGDEVKVGDEKFQVVGLASAPLGGQASDIYVHLSELQRLSDREGRVNVVRVRADDSGQVASVAAAIESGFKGSDVTTAQDLADQVTGSLSDAQDLSGTLGTALAVVALLGAILVASLLTLSSVAKRTRELGTLKAIGWRGRQVVRQIAGESLAQGLLGGAVGAALGIGAAALIGAIGIGLEATVASADTGPRFAGPGGPEGPGEAAQAATEVVLGAPVDPSLVLLAVGLAALGGLVAGAAGAARAARLRPAEALRSLE